VSGSSSRRNENRTPVGDRAEGRNGEGAGSRAARVGAVRALGGPLAASLVFAALNGFERAYDWGTAAGSPFFIGAPCMAFAVVGALIASQRQDNAVGWVCLAVGLVMTATGAAGQYALYTLTTNPGALPAGELPAWSASGTGSCSSPARDLPAPLLFPDRGASSATMRLALSELVVSGCPEALSRCTRQLGRRRLRACNERGRLRRPRTPSTDSAFP